MEATDNRAAKAQWYVAAKHMIVFIWTLLLFILVATMLLLSLGAFGLGVK